MILSELRYALRSLVRQPGYALAAILSLGLGIGVGTAVFSLVRGILLRPLPYTEGDRLLVLEQHAPGAGLEDVAFSIAELGDYRERTRSFEDVVEYHSMSFTLLGGDEPRRVLTGVVSAGFFAVLGTEPLLGRAFRPEDEALGAEAVLILGHGFWQRALGGDQGVVGRFFEMNDKPHRVVGVLPPIPQFPRQNDVYMPTSACPFRAAAEPRALESRNAFRALLVMGRTRPGVSLAQAREDVASAGRTIAAEHPDVTPPAAGHRADALPLQERLTAGARPTLALLAGIALLVLILACANVGNLSLARLLRRERELAVRASLGASRAHVVRLALAEAVLLATAGGALGVVLAGWSLDLLIAFTSRFTPRAAGVALDGGVLAFGAGVALLAALGTAALPLATGRLEAQRALAEASRGATEGPRRMRLRGALIAGQVAVSLTLLAAAGLMLQSLQRLQEVDPGFDAERVLTAELPLNWSRFTSAPENAAFFEELLRRLEAIPGVSAAAVGSTAPLSGTPPTQTAFQIEGRPREPGEIDPVLELRFASPRYFETLGIPLLRGRSFTPSDGQGAPAVVIVNQSLARRYWPGSDPVGARLSTDGGASWSTVVGVAGDVRQHSLDQAATDELYVPVFQAGFAGGIFARTLSSGSGSVGAAIKQAVHALAPDQPVTAIQPLALRREEAVAAPRLTATLLALFAGLALLVTAIGIGGLIAYSVAQRTREIGIRMALGARPRAVLAQVLGQGLRLVGLGALLGLAGAVMAGRSMQALLYQTAPADPLALSVSALLLLAVALAASLLPARRASRIDPAIALRDA
jgi:predicted permease